MADPQRDLTFNILSKADRFDLTRPAQELDALADSARDATDDLDKLERVDPNLDKLEGDAKDAGGSLEKLGDDAKATAAQVGAAFEKIEQESRSNLRKVDDHVDRARQGMDDMKGEAGQSGREAAASFSGGFDSVTDFMQETAANALAGFGAVGGAIGIAAAAGLGFLANKAQEAAENIKNARDSLRELYAAGDTTGRDKTEAFFEFLTDVGVDLPGLSRVLDAAGISMGQFISAGAQGGPIFDEVKGKLRELGNEGSGLAGFWDGNVRGAQAGYDALTQYREGAQGAADDVKIMGQVLPETTAAQEAYNAELEKAAQAKYDETLAAIAGGLRDVGDASGEIAEAVAEDGVVSIKAVTDALNAQTQAAKNHKKNLEVALKEGGAEFAAWMAGQPAEVAQAYVNGSAKERAKLRAAAAANGEAMGEGTAAGIISSRPTTVAAAAETHEHVRRKLEGEPVTIPVTVGAASNVASIRQRIIDSFGTIYVPVSPDPRAPRYGFLP